MTFVLDSGGVSGLAGSRAAIGAMRRRGNWPPLVPSVVLTECLTGDARRDFHVNRFVRLCRVVAVTEQIARRAAALRFETGRARKISAADAIVVAVAESVPDAVVITSDLDDINALVYVAAVPIVVRAGP